MKKLNNEQIFQVFKRSIKEGRCANSYNKEYGVSSGHIYNGFKRIGAPRSLVHRDKVGQN